LEIFLRQFDSFQRRRRGIGHDFHAFALGVKRDIAGHPVFAVHAVAVVDRLADERLRVIEILALGSEFCFFCREPLDDFLDRHRRRLERRSLRIGSGFCLLFRFCAWGRHRTPLSCGQRQGSACGYRCGQ